MRQVIIASSDVKRLGRFLKREAKSKEYFYIISDFNCINAERPLKERGYRKVDIHEGLGNIDFKREYIDFIGRLNYEYNSLYWWATSISYKNNFGCDLCQEIFNYYCIINLIKNTPRDYIIACDDFILSDYIAQYCKSAKIPLKLLTSKKGKSTWLNLKRTFFNNLHFVFEGWQRKFIISLYLSKKIKTALKNDKSYYVLKTWLTESSFDNGIYKDLFFGKLPSYLKQSKKEFFILAGILTNYKNVISKLRKSKEFLIIPQEYFAKYTDYLKVMLLAFRNRPRITKPVDFGGLGATNFLKRSLEKDYERGEVSKNLIYFYYLKRLSKKLRVDTIAFTFENQAWERMLILVLRKYSPSTKTIGYAHSSITQSPLNYFFSRIEEEVMPLPDKIITIGREPLAILGSGGNYQKKACLVEGCALKYDYLFKKTRMTWNRNGDILVGFSINEQYSLKLLYFLCENLRNKNSYNVVLRSHPFTSLGHIIKKWNLSINNNFSISQNARFEDDLKNASIFIYIDTTSSIEALMCGIPVVHVNFHEPTSPDPLFKLNSMKWTISDGAGLNKIIDYIYNMSEADYRAKYNDAMMYIGDYFYPAEEKYLKEFI